MKKRITLRTREAIAGFGFILPWLIGLSVFFIYNFVGTVYYSFSEISIVPGAGLSVTYRGMQNFIEAFTSHATFTRVLADSVVNMVVDVPLITFFSLFIALILNRKFAIKGAVRVIFFLPVIMATSAVNNALDMALINLMGGISTVPEEFRQTTGLNAQYIVSLFSDFGIPVAILQYLVQAVARLYEIVRGSGVQILIFLAALQTISPQLYEFAKIEGATAYDSFWKITLPMVSPLIITNVVYTIVDTYTQSRVVQMAYEVSFRQQSFGLGNAMSLISTMVTSAVLAVVCFALSKAVFYHN